MGFLVPAFLAGLAAVIVPIVLHLRHRDKDTPHRFPSLMFVERLPIRTAQRRRITDWPLLLLRALAIVLLVLAFSRPLWSRPGVTHASVGDRTVIVLLDRSMSMGHRGVWKAAVDAARRAITGLGATDRVALVALNKAKPGTAGTRYAAALRTARQIAADARTGSAPVDVVLVSDLQRSGTAGLAGLEIPSTLRVRTAELSSPASPRAG
jgi:hypothetical protein